MEKFSRVELLIGKENVNKLASARVIVFGVGGVGGYAVEALVRSGIKNIAVVDSDCVSESNINRQIIATGNTVGKKKVEVIKERILSINNSVGVETYDVFYLPENADIIDLSKYDYVIDAVDTVSAKLEIIKRAKALGVPVISCMGTGGKLYPERLKVTDISKTDVCPLARVMRRELRARGINSLKVVYSDEERSFENQMKGENGKTVPPSMIFVPATAGLILAREVIADLIKK